MSRSWGVACVAAVACLGACGGSSTSTGSGGSPSTPTTPATPWPTLAPGSALITITSAGVSPKQVEIAAGNRVVFANEDGVPHEMSSDPHPTHEQCPPINQVSALAPGQWRETGVFTAARTCGYHDHGQSTNTSLQGTIVIR